MISDEELLSKLEELSEELRRTPTKREMQSRGEYSHSTYRRRFGSWNKAVRKAGLSTRSRQNIPTDELLDDLRRLEDIIGGTPRQEDVAGQGKFNKSTYIYRFGSWRDAIQEAGLEPLKKGPPSGREHPDWSGGEYDYYGPDWQDLRVLILERDGHQCRVCEDPAENVHHIKPRKDFVIDGEYEYEEANDWDNLVSLCLSCHMTFEGKWKELDHAEFVCNAKELISRSDNSSI